jgi:nicotinamide-nucleotide amidase
MREIMKQVTVISTGNELLNGSTQDTNSSFISFRFFATNFKVKRILVVGDSFTDLVNAMKESLSSSDFVFITGGLGPTDDDNTIEALQMITGFTLIKDKDSEEKLIKVFKELHREVGPSDLKMATVPEGSVVFRNSIGLAPGFFITEGSCSIIAMPGVPDEMTDMFDNEIIPYLSAKGLLKQGESLVFRITGIKETEVNSQLNRLGIAGGEREWGMTTRKGVVTVSFIHRTGEFNLLSLKEKISDIFGNDLIGFQHETPEEELLELLKKSHSTLAVAESCTGGMISERMTDIPGSSAVFTGGVVAYSNSMKRDLLNVSDELINRKGAVSEEVAGEMARGVKELCKSRFGVSVTGIAGPEGGSEEKPVGRVCFGFDLHDKVITVTRQLSGNRERIRNISSHYVIDYMRRYLLNKNIHN